MLLKENIIIPEYLNEYKFKKFRNINIDKIYVGQYLNNFIKYVNVRNTSHYNFANKYLSGNLNQFDIDKYQKYILSNNQDHEVDNFIKLIEAIKNNEFDFVKHPILVFKNIRLPLYFVSGKFCVLDGFHRISILSALGYTSANCAVLTKFYKY